MRELIYGRNAVYECLRAKRREVFKLLVAEGAQEKGALAQSLQLAASSGKRIPLQRVPRAQLDRVSEGHQGVVAEVSGYPYAALDDILSRVDTPASCFSCSIACKTRRILARCSAQPKPLAWRASSSPKTARRESRRRS